MSTPDFIVNLRKDIGHQLLWLPGVTAVVVRDAPGGDEQQVLLVRRADNGAWTPVTGIVDPGEQPAVAAAREVLEEAGIVAEPQALVRVQSLAPVRYDNGDHAQYLDLAFRFRYVSGEAHPADGENTDAEWFALEELPAMSHEMLARIEAATNGQVAATFSL